MTNLVSLRDYRTFDISNHVHRIYSGKEVYYGCFGCELESGCRSYKKVSCVKFFKVFLMNLRNKQQMILIGTNIILIDINMAVKLSFGLILLRCTYFNNLS